MGSSNATSLRRSTRPRRVPVSYVIPDEDQMDDVKYTELPAQHQQQVGSADDSDGEYGAKPKKKKLKFEHKYETILPGSVGDKEEENLRKICKSLGIQFNLFDSWVEDPKLQDLSKINIPFLPNEIIAEIFGYCRSEVLVQCEKSCRRFKSILKDNTTIWRRARLCHYPHPSLEPELAYNLDEASLFKLATEKRCDYCESEKTRPYYAWSIRSCHECIKPLTMSISEFKRMFKKKCDDEEDWTPYRREKVCNVIHWRRNLNYSKICWKEYAYNLMEEAENEMLAGTFDEWIKAKRISPKQKWKTISLESWGSTIPKRIAEDRRVDEMKLRKLRIAYFHDWCMCLPRPIPEKTLKKLDAYWTFLRSSSYPTKSEFIHQLPKLLREHGLFEDKERRKEELKTLYRIRQGSVIDNACSNIIQQVMREGPLSATAWCAILQEALQQVSKASIEIKIPRGTPTSVFMFSEDWKCGWDGSHLMRLVGLLEDKLRSRVDGGAREELLHPASYEFFYSGEDRVFACPATALITGSTSHEACKSECMMNFQELVSHLLSTHPHGCGHPRRIWTAPQEVIVIHTTAKKALPLTLISGKQYMQKKLQEWFKPLPQMVGTEDSGEWVRYSGVFKTFMKRKMKSGNSDIVVNFNTGTQTVGNLTASVSGISKNNDLKSGGKEGRCKSITTYFHIQKKSPVKV